MKPPVLLLIDYQKGFAFIAARVHRNNIEAEARALALLTFWREMGWPVIHVRHDSQEPQSPFRPGQIGNEPMVFAADLEGEAVVRKSVNSAFIGTDLAERLDTLGRPDVVVAGATTDHCVSTTVRMGANLGYAMTLIEDACFTFDREAPNGTVVPADMVHAAHVASLNGEFARVTTAAELMRELEARAEQ
ncbi:MAG: cysteine hydrolase [Proteobacteria bacterium]|jgi:Amidases related to nicotinamidase|nr:MAG: cysteine hydrolase [Pseudomonadota bacterium]